MIVRYSSGMFILISITMDTKYMPWMRKEIYYMTWDKPFYQNHTQNSRISYKVIVINSDRSLKDTTSYHQMCQYKNNDVGRFAAGYCIEKLLWRKNNFEWVRNIIKAKEFNSHDFLFICN